MKTHLNILLLEDSQSDVELVQYTLRKSNIQHTLKVVDSQKEFEEHLDEFKPDIVLSDHSLPSFNSMEALAIVRERGLDIPFILVTGAVSEEFAVNCMKAGADDYILKDRLVRLPSSIEACFSKKQLSREKGIVERLHSKLLEAFAELEEKNRNITDSIHYARRIQESLLPSADVLKRIFPESFIFYQPKDLIGGDFYWFTEKDNTVYLAVADCTGHGVPGALMSMIGFSLLNEITGVQGVTDPAEILKLLNRGIRRVLKQDITEEGTHAGMDIAICSIGKNNFDVHFAGANRPLLYCRKGEHTIIRGNRGGIGGSQISNNRHFDSHRFVAEPGDMIFLYTDGYADQFGGRRKKKMMNRDVVKMLQTFHLFDSQKQDILLREWLTEWKGDLEQTDDILLLGIKF